MDFSNVKKQWMKAARKCVIVHSHAYVAAHAPKSLTAVVRGTTQIIGAPWNKFCSVTQQNFLPPRNVCLLLQLRHLPGLVWVMDLNACLAYILCYFMPTHSNATINSVIGRPASDWESCRLWRWFESGNWSKFFILVHQVCGSKECNDSILLWKYFFCRDAAMRLVWLRSFR